MEQSLPSALTQIQWVDALNALSLANQWPQTFIADFEGIIPSVVMHH